MENLNENPVDAGQETVVESHEAQVETSEPVESGSPEVAEPEKAKQTPEENALFAKVRREAEERARAKAEDEVIAKLYGETHGIRTMAEYNAAIEAQREAERLAELEEKGIDPEYFKSLIESVPEVKEARRIKSEREREQAETQNYIEFLDHFKTVNGREYDGAKDVLPEEVWQLTSSGMPLKMAYDIAEAKMLRAELNALKSEKTAKETNQKNASKSPGAIGTNGEIPNEGFISAETFEQNRGNMDWVKKNLERITKSRKTW